MKKIRILKLLGISLPILFFLLLIWGCQTKLIEKKAEKEDCKANKNPIKESHKNQNDKSTYLDDYEVVDLNDEKSSAHGKTYNAQGINNKALSEYRKTFRIDPDNPDALLKSHDAYTGKDKFGKTISDDATITAINPGKDDDTFIKKGSVYSGSDKSNDALSKYTTAIKLNPDNDKAFVKRGDVYAANGNPDKAISDYTTATKIKPDNEEAFIKRGDAYAGKGKPNKAVSDYTAAIEINPDNDSAFVNRGDVYAGIGDSDRAVSDYTTAIEINPDNDEAFVKRAKVYTDKGKFSQAISDYEKVLKGASIPKDTYQESHVGYPSPKVYSLAAVTYYNWGLDLAGKGAFYNAIKVYNRAVELNPDFAEAYNNRGVAHFFKNQNDNLFSGNIDFFHFQTVDHIQEEQLQEVLLQQENAYKESLRDLSAAISLKPFYAEAYFNRGTVYSEMGQYEKAISDFDQAIKIDEKYIDAYYNRGNSFAEQERYDKAILDYDFVIELKPDFAAAYYNRGNAIFITSKEKGKACLDWEKACALSDRCDAIMYGRSNGFCD